MSGTGTTGNVSGGNASGNLKTLPTNEAKLLGQWIVGQVYPTLIGGGGNAASTPNVNMQNIPSGEVTRLAQEVFRACGEYQMSGHFPTTIANYSGS